MLAQDRPKSNGMTTVFKDRTLDWGRNNLPYVVSFEAEALDLPSFEYYTSLEAQCKYQNSKLLEPVVYFTAVVVNNPKKHK